MDPGFVQTVSEVGSLKCGPMTNVSPSDQSMNIGTRVGRSSGTTSLKVLDNCSFLQNLGGELHLIFGEPESESVKVRDSLSLSLSCSCLYQMFVVLWVISPFFGQRSRRGR